MESEIHQSFAQLFGVGIIWVSVHCVGMCGPILIGLDVGGLGSAKGFIQGVLRILAYQAGRAMVYASLGAVFGVLGVGIASSFEKAGAVFALAFACVLIIYTLSQMSFFSRQKVQSCEKKCKEETNLKSNTDQLIILTKKNLKAADRERLIKNEKNVFWRNIDNLKSKIMFLLAKANKDAGYLGSFLTGLSLAFMPCMITFWVLGLAAMTASPFYGALLIDIISADDHADVDCCDTIAKNFQSIYNTKLVTDSTLSQIVLGYLVNINGLSKFGFDCTYSFRFSAWRKTLSFDALLVWYCLKSRNIGVCLYEFKKS